MNELLIDSGFLYALFDRTDKHHQAAISVRISEKGMSVVPDVVLVEAAFLVRRNGGSSATASFLETLERWDFRLEAINMADLKRSRQIMQTYADARLDFVDCCLMALAERLNIQTICTVDPRDFLIFRPTHCEALETLP